MTDGGIRVPNERSPGTPVCHPNDDHRPAIAAEPARARDCAQLPASESEYIELHATSAFSFLAGGSLPEKLMERAKELEMPAMALADRNGVYGAARFHTAAQGCGTTAHIGAEIAVASFSNRMT